MAGADKERWGRDGVMCVAVRDGEMQFTEAVRSVGLQYQAAAQAVKRFAQTLANKPEPLRFVARLKSEMSTI
jgi:endonuclease V-like protein UPF0215 family